MNSAFNSLVFAESKANRIEQYSSIEDIEEYSKKNKVKEIVIKDFAGNEFILNEIEPMGYTIYTRVSNRFVEGSYVNKSPYHKLINTEDLFYLGRVIISIRKEILLII